MNLQLSSSKLIAGKVLLQATYVQPAGDAPWQLTSVSTDVGGELRAESCQLTRHGEMADPS